MLVRRKRTDGCSVSSHTSWWGWGASKLKLRPAEKAEGVKVSRVCSVAVLSANDRAASVASKPVEHFSMLESTLCDLTRSERGLQGFEKRGNANPSPCSVWTLQPVP